MKTLDLEAVTRALLRATGDPTANPRTESLNRGRGRGVKKRLAILSAAYPEQPGVDYQRPVTRADCLPGGANEARPCPFVSCKWHLYLDVAESNGSITYRHPGEEVGDHPETCALDIADDGPQSHDTIAQLRGITHNAINIMEKGAIARLARKPIVATLAQEAAESSTEHRGADRRRGGR